MSQMRSRWVMVNGIRTHYTEGGDEGPAVILLHGGGPGASGMAGFRLLIPALSRHFRVYAVDQLSFGLTDSRPHAWPVEGHQSLVNHIAGFIDTLCLDEVMMLGQSLGAYIAVKYAVDHPGKVKRLFLIGSGTIALAMGLTLPENPALRHLREFDGSEKTMREVLERIVLDKSTITDQLIKDRLDAANRPGMREARQAFADEAKRRASDPDWRLRFDLRSQLPQLKVPTKFIWGKLDRFWPPSVGEQLAKVLPNMEFAFVEGAGHQSQTDQPEIVNRMVIEHFRT